MERDFNYYKKQLKVLKSKGYPISIKLFSEGGNTKQMNLNPQSIGAIIEYLEQVKKEGV